MYGSGARPGSVKANAAPVPNATAIRSIFLSVHTEDPTVRPASSGGHSGQTGGARRDAGPDLQTKTLLDLVIHSLDDDKAEQVVSIDLRGKTPIADYMVVASGRSQRHVGAMADHLVRRLKESGRGSARVEGMPQCDWVLIDGGDVIVHLFRPEVRDFYKLEKMWSAQIPTDQLAV